MHTITVITSTRADYGLLRPVLIKIAENDLLRLKLVVTGTHLLEKYGNTIEEIKQDEKYGVKIDSEIELIRDNTPIGRAEMAQTTAYALQKAVNYYLQNPTDLVLVLGDRYEIFAFAEAAALLSIPVAHISGGDVTYGADDDWFRHCITKMAKLHFPSCELYRERLLRMGEQPSTVFNVGGLGDENIRKVRLLSKEELSQSLAQIGVSRIPDVLVTFHPETAENIDPIEQIQALLKAVEENSDLFYVFTGANADAGGEQINQMIAEFCDTHENCEMIFSLGMLRYLSAMQYAKLVLGNSSSGVIETPSFGVPAVNVGKRQNGRLICENVLCCDAQSDEISAAICKATSEAFIKQAKNTKSPYNGGNTSGKIVAFIDEFLQSGVLKQAKIFYDGAEESQ